MFLFFQCLQAQDFPNFDILRLLEQLNSCKNVVKVFFVRIRVKEFRDYPNLYIYIYVIVYP